MRLLPDFRHNGDTFSMQSPYTLNGLLISKLNVKYDEPFYYNSSCRIMFECCNKNGISVYGYVVEEGLFKEAINRFICSYDYFEEWIGIKRPRNLREYVEFVQIQCERYNRYENRYMRNELQKDIYLLRKQNRDEKYRYNYEWCHDLGNVDYVAEGSNQYLRQYMGIWETDSNSPDSDLLTVTPPTPPAPLEGNSEPETIGQNVVDIVMNDGAGNEMVFNNVNISDISIQNDAEALSADSSDVEYVTDLIGTIPDGESNNNILCELIHSAAGIDRTDANLRGDVVGIESPVDSSVNTSRTINTMINVRNRDSISFSSSSASYGSPYTYSYTSRNIYSNVEDHVLYIHRYNYKPEFVYHTLGQECSPLLLGAEIEVAGNTKDNERSTRNDIVKKCIQIMNGSDDTKEDLIYSTDDSTVQIEIDTMPCSLEFHKTMNYKKMFEYLDEQGYKGHDCDNAGLHIHADRKYLGDTVLKQQLVISKILYVLEKFNDQICMIARRGNYYSRFVGDGKNENTVVELYKKYKDKGKYVALNLGHKDTIEFRCFKSTLKYETFILTLEFVQDIIDFCKKINIEEIETIQWKDLMETFSEELRKYYKERVEKEALKKKDRSAFDIKCDIASSESINGYTCYGGRIGTYTPQVIVNIRSPDECVDTSSNIGELPSGDMVFSHEDTSRLMDEARVDTISSTTSYLSDSFGELSSRISDIEDTIRQYQRQLECVENGVINSESLADVAADLSQYYLHREVCNEIDSRTVATLGADLDSSPGLSNNGTFIDSS